MYKLKIKVTKDILRRSMYCAENNSSETPTNCAIALAVRDIFPDATVGLELLGFGETLNNYYVSHNQKRFITMFDMCAPGERLNLPELEFEVEIPDEEIEKSLINIDELKQQLINHPTLELTT